MLNVAKFIVLVCSTPSNHKHCCLRGFYHNLDKQYIYVYETCSKNRSPVWFKIVKWYMRQYTEIESFNSKLQLNWTFREKKSWGPVKVYKLLSLIVRRIKISLKWALCVCSFLENMHFQVTFNMHIYILSQIIIS